MPARLTGTAASTAARPASRAHWGRAAASSASSGRDDVRSSRRNCRRSRRPAPTQSLLTPSASPYLPSLPRKRRISGLVEVSASSLTLALVTPSSSALIRANSVQRTRLNQAVVAAAHPRAERLLRDDLRQHDMLFRVAELEQVRRERRDVGGVGVAAAGLIGLAGHPPPCRRRRPRISSWCGGNSRRG